MCPVRRYTQEELDAFGRYLDENVNTSALSPLQLDTPKQVPPELNVQGGVNPSSPSIENTIVQNTMESIPNTIIENTTDIIFLLVPFCLTVLVVYMQYMLINYRLINILKSKYGRKSLGITAYVVTIYFLPKFFVSLNLELLIRWAICIFGYGSVSYIAGHIYGSYNNNKKTA